METRCVTGVWQSIGGEPVISVWMVVAGVLVVLLALAIVFIVKLFRQVATLKYCWMKMSDKCADGAESDTWRSTADHHFSIFKRQGIRVGSEADVKWVVLADWW